MFRFVNQFFRITLVEWRTMLRDPACMLIIVVGVLLYAFYYPYPEKPPVSVCFANRLTEGTICVIMAKQIS